jgi:elongation factor P
MALIGANELKKKMLIEVEGQPYHVLDVFFATPTARGASTMVRTRLKNLLNASVRKGVSARAKSLPNPMWKSRPCRSYTTTGMGSISWISPLTSNLRCATKVIADDRNYLKEGLIP